MAMIHSGSHPSHERARTISRSAESSRSERAENALQLSIVTWPCPTAAELTVSSFPSRSRDHLGPTSTRERACDTVFFMAPTKTTLASSTNVKKRKSDAAPTKPGPSKVSRHSLDSYFVPRIAVSCGNKKETNLVTLNEEQRSVLRMVVDEGKNVFFTGSAVCPFRYATAS